MCRKSLRQTTFTFPPKILYLRTSLVSQSNYAADPMQLEGEMKVRSSPLPFSKYFMLHHIHVECGVIKSIWRKVELDSQLGSIYLDSRQIRQQGSFTMLRFRCGCLS